MGSCISHVDPESLKLHAEAEEILKKVCSRPSSAESRVACSSPILCHPLSLFEIIRKGIICTQRFKAAYSTEYLSLAPLCGTDERAISGPEFSDLLRLSDPYYSQAKRKMDAEAKVRHVQPPLLLFSFADIARSLDPTQILLLGPGDSGKSTVIRQMRILTKVPWTPIELESYRQIVFSNLIQGMKGIFQSLEELGISLERDQRALGAYAVRCSPLSELSTKANPFVTS